MQRKAGCANLAQKRPWFGQMCKRCAAAFLYKKERRILRFNALLLVHLQGLEPWAHWLRETNVQQSSIFKIASIRYFYRFIVNLCFASAAFFAPVIPSCIRYPAVPVCKKCAKMCRAKISPLNRHWVFMQSRETGQVRAWNGSYDIICLDQASNVHSQLWFMAGIWTIE